VAAVLVELVAAVLVELVAAVPVELAAAVPVEPVAAVPVEPVAAVPVEPAAAVLVEPAAAVPVEPAAAARAVLLERVAMAEPVAVREVAERRRWARSPLFAHCSIAGALAVITELALAQAG
jgi:hypothetical protein